MYIHTRNITTYLFDMITHTDFLCSEATRTVLGTEAISLKCSYVYPRPPLTEYLVGSTTGNKSAINHFYSVTMAGKLTGLSFLNPLNTFIHGIHPDTDRQSLLDALVLKCPHAIASAPRYAQTLCLCGMPC